VVDQQPDAIRANKRRTSFVWRGRRRRRRGLTGVLAHQRSKFDCEKGASTPRFNHRSRRGQARPGPGGSLALAVAVALLEALDAATGIDQLLLAGEERVAFVA
jgi:hypothetical protein